MANARDGLVFRADLATAVGEAVSGQTQASERLAEFQSTACLSVEMNMFIKFVKYANNAVERTLN